MWASDAVNASMPLNKAHRIPGNVEIDNIPALLKVDALGQHVGSHKDVETIGVPARGCLRRYRGKSVDSLLTGKFFEVIVAGYGDYATAVRSKRGISIDLVSQKV